MTKRQAVLGPDQSFHQEAGDHHGPHDLHVWTYRAWISYVMDVTEQQDFDYDFRRVHDRADEPWPENDDLADDLIQPAAALKPCHFSIDDGPPFDGFELEGAWSGAGQVAVLPAGRDMIAAWLARRGQYAAAKELLDRRTGPAGLVSLANGYAVTILDI